jgi:hypothetical protein
MRFASKQRQEAGLAKRYYAALVAAVAWFAVIGQYLNSTTTTGNYFSYFTILSNVLVALITTAAALGPESAFGRFLNRPPVATATALYITVTGLVYFFILAPLYHLTGWVLFFDQVLHYVVPPAYVLFWLIFVPKGMLGLRNIAWMLIFPLAYGAYTLLRGPLVDWYPYPFIDATQLGYPKTLRNIGEFTLFFAFMGSIYVLVDHVLGHLRRGA